jgi:hypothetical protein
LFFAILISLCSLAFAGERIYIELSPRRAASGFRRRSVSRSLLILCAAILFLCLAIFEIKKQRRAPFWTLGTEVIFLIWQEEQNRQIPYLLFFSAAEQQHFEPQLFAYGQPTHF